MTTVDPLCVRAVRRWVGLYTRGLPAEAVERRMLELESDMWEHLHDADEQHPSRAVLGRTLRGIPADVRWRYRTLLDARGARQRNQHMHTTTPSRWWVILTGLLAVVPLGITVAMIAVDGGGGGAIRMAGLAVSIATAALLLIGLAQQRHDVVSGSRLIVAGAALTVVSGGEFIPVGIIVLVSGFWTGNLQLSQRVDVPDLSPVSRQHAAMTRYWYLWLCAAAALFAIGWLPLVFDDPNDLSSGGWFVWALAWFGAIITGAIGATLAVLRLVVRHRTAGATSPTSPAA